MEKKHEMAWTFTNANNSEFIDIEGDYRICSIDIGEPILEEIGVTKEQAFANAELIVTAVNSYQNLKESHAELLDIVKGFSVIFYKHLQGVLMPDGKTEMYPIIKAAIDKANKQQLTIKNYNRYD